MGPNSLMVVYVDPLGKGSGCPTELAGLAQARFLGLYVEMHGLQTLYMWSTWGHFGAWGLDSKVLDVVASCFSDMMHSLYGSAELLATNWMLESKDAECLAVVICS